MPATAAPGTGEFDDDRIGGTPQSGPSAPSALTWVDGSGIARTRQLPRGGRLVIGRSDAADIALTWDASVSRRHAAVMVVDGTVSVRDLGSRNGTFHNGVRLDADDRPEAFRPVRAGDLVRCGDTVLAVKTGCPRQPPARRHTG